MTRAHPNRTTCTPAQGRGRPMMSDRPAVILTVILFGGWAEEQAVRCGLRSDSVRTTHNPSRTTECSAPSDWQERHTLSRPNVLPSIDHTRHGASGSRPPGPGCSGLPTNGSSRKVSMSWPVCIDTEREDVRRRSSRGPGHGCGQEGCGQEARQCQLTLRPQAIPVVAAGGRNPLPRLLPPRRGQTGARYRRAYPSRSRRPLRPRRPSRQGTAPHPLTSVDLSRDKQRE